MSAQGIVESLPEETETDWAKPGFWQTTDGRPIEQSWEFAEAEIRLVKPRGGAGSLISGPLPAHFELSWQWKIDSKTNSGVKYRVRKFDRRWLGLEYQIIDYAPGSTRARARAARQRFTILCRRSPTSLCIRPANGTGHASSRSVIESSIT